MKIIKKIFPQKFILFIKKELFVLNIIKYFFIKRKVEKMLDKANIQFIDNDALIKSIIEDKVSLSRYGDGEFGCMLQKGKDIFFQQNSSELKTKLLDSFYNNNPFLKIGILGIFNSENLNKYKFKVKVYWYNFLNTNFKEISSLIENDKIYADSLITRCYIDLKEDCFCLDNFENVKKIWENRDIIIVEGAKTRMGIGNDLFQKAKSIKRIICPSVNAFEKYDEIFEIIKQVGKNKIILLALGPTASILASDVCNLNKEAVEYQAIDLGHLDIEYEWYLSKSNEKKAIKGKFVNEVRSEDLSDCDLDADVLETYQKQIIYRIG